MKSRLLCAFVAAGVISAIIYTVNMIGVRAVEKVSSSGDLTGDWIGKWNWDSSSETLLRFDREKLYLENFPYIADEGKVSFITEAARVEFAGEYGSSSKPCFLVYFSSSKNVAALYLVPGWLGSVEMIYDFDISRDKRIHFRRVSNERRGQSTTSDKIPGRKLMDLRAR